MRKNAFYLILVILMLAVSLPATQPARTNQALGIPVLPFSPWGKVQYNGFNIDVCNNVVNQLPNPCLDVQATCGTFTFIYGEIAISDLDNKSYYSMQIPFDDPETLDIEGCSDDEPITFTIKGEPAEQNAIPWLRETSMQYDISFGSPNLVFLPMIRR